MQSSSEKILKNTFRNEIKGQLREQTRSLRDEASRRIQEKLISSKEFISARTVMSYISTDTEVETTYFNRKVLESGKRLVVPVIDRERQEIIASELKSIEDLIEGPFGIYEPRDGLEKQTTVEEIDLIIVPAIAYDRHNMRLGRGKGYYDRFLADKRLSRTKTVGLAFHFQIVDVLPSDPHDIPVSTVITN